MNFSELLPLLTLLTSLVPAVVIFWLREDAQRTRTVMNISGAALKLLCIAAMLRGVYLGDPQEFRLPLIPNVDLILRADSLGMFFVTLSGLLWFLTTIYAITYLKGSPHRRRFFGFFSLCVSATVGIALAGNLFTFVIFYELLTLATYPLVVHRQTEDARSAGRVYLAHTLTGGALLLLGAAWLHVYVANVEFDGGASMAGVAQSHTGPLRFIFALLVSGLGVKAALVPLHNWLPRAMVAPAPVSALLHAVAVVKAGAFGIVRVVYDIFGIELSRDLGLLLPLALLASATIVYGSVCALFQNDLKRRLAFSTISQVSYIALGVTVGGPSSTIGGIAHLVHQGLMKITLFFCAGNLAETLGIHKVSEMHGVGRRMPGTMAAFSVAALGMIGIPPMAGFISKWYLAAGAIEGTQYWVLVVLGISTALNAAYFLPILGAAWFGKQPGPWPKSSVDGHLDQTNFRDGDSVTSGQSQPALERPRPETAWGLLIPPVTTAILSIVAGLFAGSPISPLQWAALVVDRAYGRLLSPPGGVEIPVLLSFEGLLLLAAVLVPLLLAAGLISRRSRRWVMAAAPLAALPAVVLGFYGEAGMRIDMSWVLLDMHLGLDATGQTFLIFTSLLWLIAGIYARGYLADDPRAHQFFGWFMLTMAGNFGLVVSLDMASFYLFFAVMSLSAYGMIVHDRSLKSFSAGRVYIWLVVIGEIALFAGMVLATLARGSLLFTSGVDDLIANPTLNLTIGLLLIGFGIKVGIVPLHVWLPLAHPAAPTPASAVLSGAMIKAGLLGWIRFLPIGDAAFPGWGQICLWVGSVTAIYAAIVGVTQANAKSVLAYSSISQMGVLTLGLGGGLLVPQAWPLIAPAMMIYALHHSLTKGCLFLSVGIAAGTAGNSWWSRFVNAGLVIPALAMVGAPLTIGAVAKSGLKYSLTEMPPTWIGIIEYLFPMVAIGTTLLMARFLYLIWPRVSVDRIQNSRWSQFAWVILLGIVISATWMIPRLPAEISGVGASGADLLEQTLSWSNLWPLLVGCCISLFGWQLSRSINMRRMMLIPAGDLLSVLGWLVNTVDIRPRLTIWVAETSRSAFSNGLWRRVDQTAVRRLAERIEASILRWPWIGVVVVVIAATILLWATPR